MTFYPHYFCFSLFYLMVVTATSVFAGTQNSDHRSSVKMSAGHIVKVSEPKAPAKTKIKANRAKIKKTKKIVKYVPEMISFDLFKKLSSDKKVKYLKGLRELVYETSRISKKKSHQLFASGNPLNLREGYGTRGSHIEARLWDFLLVPSYADEENTSAATAPATNPDKKRGHRKFFNVPPGGNLLIPPVVPLMGTKSPSVVVPSSASPGVTTPVVRSSPADSRSGGNSPTMPENASDTDSQTDFAEGDSAVDGENSSVDEFSHLATKHPNSCGTYQPECSPRDSKADEFRALNMNRCIYAGHFRTYQGGKPIPGKCTKPTKWRDFSCRSGEVICNPLVFGLQSGGTPYCVSPSPDATESCYIASEGQGSMDFIKNVSADKLDEFRNDWNDLSEGFNQICADTGEQKAFEFFCYECKAIMQRLLNLNVVALGDECHGPDWEKYYQKVTGASLPSSSGNGNSTHTGAGDGGVDPSGALEGAAD